VQFPFLWNRSRTGGYFRRPSHRQSAGVRRSLGTEQLLHARALRVWNH
jgi:hypothetical protein